MGKMSFREAQLCVLGTLYEGEYRHRVEDEVVLNEEQKFRVGDLLEVIGIMLTSPHIVLQMDQGEECLCHIDNFSDKVIDECVEIMRGVAANEDFDNHKKDLRAIKSANNPRA
jgi:hypothetical protein